MDMQSVVVGRWLGGLVDQRLRGRAMEPPMRVLLVRVLRAVVMLFAALVALDKLGFQVAPLVAGIGVAGIGVGFALQGVLSNVIAGLTIIFTKPFRVGEYVEMVIPNRKIVGEILHNYGTTRQLHLLLTVPHGADLTAALTAATDVVTRNERVLKNPAPAVGIVQVTDTGIRIGVNPWVRVVDVGAVEGELNRALVEHFRGRGVGLGLGPSDVRLVNGTTTVRT